MSPLEVVKLTSLMDRPVAAVRRLGWIHFKEDPNEFSMSFRPKEEIS